MTDDAAFLDRIERLEAALAHQEATVEDLNRMIVDQWKRIDDLTRHVRDLTEQVLEFDQQSAGRRPADPPPPHY